MEYLVSRMPMVEPGNPATYVGYKEVHTALDLSLEGSTYGESLKAQGLISLADWTEVTGKPAITGLIIDQRKLMPGNGYFDLFHKSTDDFVWWKNEIIKSKAFDWSPFLNNEPPESPTVADIELPERIEVTTYRILRDTTLARRIKRLHDFACQICGHSITLPDGSSYAEAHHIQPLGSPHDGPDVEENIICLCPNHHAEFDLVSCHT